ncbi:phosphatase PAP2 family protein [Starkeya koreensis]|uniref:Phosphatase PAP2 family protein n=1 Tax=Ancylobacter koreensis TaxID=266121 RepID=A0ABT0DLH0_9HYPH|nr:phosphatase PAP2 family protein [Ancylobacter koreensis]MCK0208140.1 phosphatase PAP2 family protein [Ancylobacter koreensis]
MIDFGAFREHVCDDFKRRPVTYTIALAVFVSAFFYLFSGIDRAVAGLFYVEGEGFPASRIAKLQDFRDLASQVTLTFPVLLLLTLVLKVAFPAKPPLVSPRLSLYFVTLFLLGPGLLVNGMLKVLWGRPRPINIEAFGGAWPFQEAWVIGSQWSNRSFTSGEAATVACLLPLVVFTPREWRGPVGVLIGLFVAAVSLNRMAFGAHFLSDVTISIVLVLVLAALLYRLMFVTRTDLFSDAALDYRLTRLGDTLAGIGPALRRRLAGRSSTPAN